MCECFTESGQRRAEADEKKLCEFIIRNFSGDIIGGRSMSGTALRLIQRLNCDKLAILKMLVKRATIIDRGLAIVRRGHWLNQARRELETAEAVKVWRDLCKANENRLTLFR